jgi:hypothetical protein
MVVERVMSTIAPFFPLSQCCVAMIVRSPLWTVRGTVHDVPKVPLVFGAVRRLTSATISGLSGGDRRRLSVTCGLQNSITPQPDPRNVTLCPRDTVFGDAVTLIGVAACATAASNRHDAPSDAARVSRRVERPDTTCLPS